MESVVAEPLETWLLDLQSPRNISLPTTWSTISVYQHWFVHAELFLPTALLFMTLLCKLKLLVQARLKQRSKLSKCIHDIIYQWEYITIKGMDLKVRQLKFIRQKDVSIGFIIFTFLPNTQKCTIALKALYIIRCPLFNIQVVIFTNLESTWRAFGVHRKLNCWLSICCEIARRPSRLSGWSIVTFWISGIWKCDVLNVLLTTKERVIKM